MTLARRLYAYLLALHLLLFGCTLLLLRDQGALFVAVEALLMASLAGGVHLVRRALQPLAYTRRFRDLLQDQDYAARLIADNGKRKRKGGQGELDELVALFNGMLSTLYSERLALGEQRGFLEHLLEATPSAVLVFDFDGRISLMNASAQHLLGLGQAAAQGKRLDAWPAGSGAGLLEQLDALPQGASRLLTDHEGRRYRGQRGRFVDRGFGRDFLLVEELTDELERSERAAYDKLVRVLAHEVNNTVAATGSVLDSLLYYSSQLAGPDQDDFATAIVAVKRRNASLGEFIERFTRVIKMPEPDLRPCAIAPIMNDILWLNREHCRQRGIAIGWGQCDAVPLQAMDAQLMEQALLNIVKNAVEAAEEAQTHSGKAGRIVFDLVQEEGEEGRVRLSVSDSGKLLGAAPARQLFTPFFSTKKGGKGIGLMFVREVLTRHGFGYRLAPSDDCTRFDIWF